MLLNAFNLAEGAITDGNYDEMLQNLNSTISGSEIIQGLSLNTCNLRTFLSDVWFLCKLHKYFWKVLISFSVHESVECCRWSCSCFPGCGGNRPGLHCLHRGHHKDAYFSSLVCPLFHHALLSRALNHVWKYRGSRGSFAGPKHFS